MIPVAETLNEAIHHFSHPNNLGPIMCEKGNKSKICKTLEEAEIFFGKGGNAKRNKVRPIK